MNDTDYDLYQIADEIAPPESGKKSVVLGEGPQHKFMAFAFAEGEGLSEHVAPLPVTISVVSGNCELTIRDKTVEGKPGTVIRLDPKVPHSVCATTPLVISVMFRK